MPAAFSSLSNRNFRYLWLGQFTTATAMHADMVARGILVWELTESSTAVGGVLGVRAIPMLIFGIFGGVAADRFDRKKLLMVIQSWSLAMHVIMATLILTDAIQLWHVYVLAIGLGSSMALNQPVRTSIVPNLVSKNQLINALSLNSIAMNSSRLVGPAIIAFVIHLTNTGAAYVWSAIAYVVVLWLTTRINMPEIVGRRSTVGPVTQLMEGFRYIAAHRMILALVLLGLAPLSIGFAHQTLLPQLVDELGYDTSMIGYIVSVGAIGGLTGGLMIASHTSIRSKGMFMLASTISYALAMFGFAGAAWLDMVFLAFPLMMLVGVSQTAFRAMNTTILMETTPDHMRGRVVATTLLDTGLMPVAALGAGIIADERGVGAGYMALGAGCLAVITLVLVIYPRVRKL
jgi:MFS family permease